MLEIARSQRSLSVHGSASACRHAPASAIPVTPMIHPPGTHDEIFEPHELANLARAFAGAVTIAADENGPYARLPGHLLRRRLAHAVLDAARQGVRDVALLRAQALRSVAATLDVAPTIHAADAGLLRKIAA